MEYKYLIVFTKSGDNTRQVLNWISSPCGGGVSESNISYWKMSIAQDLRLRTPLAVTILNILPINN